MLIVLSLVCLARTTGSQPRGQTCLHLAADGSDKTYGRADLVRLLVDHKANLEEKAGNGNTAYLLASGTGASDVMKTLVECRADIHAVKDKSGQGAWQKAALSSGSNKRELAKLGLGPPAQWAPSGTRQRTNNVSESRQARYAHAAASGLGDGWQKSEWWGWQKSEWWDRRWQ